MGAARERQGAGDRRPGTKRALGRPAQTDRDARSLRRSPASRSTSRRSWCCRPRPARRSPRSRRCSPPSGQELAFEPMDYGPLLGGAGGAARIGGVLAGQSLRAAPDQGRRRARSFPRLHGGVRPRRDLQVRRPRGEERHRLRPLQADGRLLGHARGDDRRDDQDAAAARETEATVLVLRPRRRRRGRGHGGRHGLVLRRVGRGASAGPGRRPHSDGLPTAGAAVTALRLEGVAPRSRIARRALAGADEAVRRLGRRRGARAARQASATRRCARTSSARCDGRSRPLTARPAAESGASRPRRRAAPSSAALIAAQAEARDALRLGRRPGLGRAAARPTTPARRSSARRSPRCGGHATLVRAPAAVRAAVDVFEPQDAGARRADQARQGELRSEGRAQSGPHVGGSVRRRSVLELEHRSCSPCRRLPRPPGHAVSGLPLRPGLSCLRASMTRASLSPRNVPARDWNGAQSWTAPARRIPHECRLAGGRMREGPVADERMRVAMRKADAAA